MQRRNQMEGRGVSPVIGVILMVAITVILAAVIATFVLGLGEQITETGPTADFDFDYDGDGTLTIAHTNGQTIEADRLSVSGASETAWEDSHSRVSAGDAIEVDTDADSVVHIIWEGDGQSRTLDTWRGPEA